MNIDQIKNTIQSAHLNFLLGSGVSRPYLDTLGSIEIWLTELSDSPSGDNIKNTIVKCSILNEYLIGVILPNLEEVIKINYEKYSEWELRELLEISPEPTEEEKRGISFISTVNEYKHFLELTHTLLSRRSTNLRNKTINLFTTNIDTLIEYANQGLGIEFNDGFSGRKPSIYDDCSFSKQAAMVGLHSQKSSEIPTINYIKLHGSINWIEGDNNKIIADDLLNAVVVAKNSFAEIKPYLIDVKSKLESYNAIEKSARKSSFVSYLLENTTYNQTINNDIMAKLYNAINDYSKIVMINPTKQKFRETVMDMPFYELMRLYSNSLERENSVLFVAGFSFADEHLAKLTLRAANNNPTLNIVIFAYNDVAKKDILTSIRKVGNISNGNILCISPIDFKNANGNDESSKIQIHDIQDLEHFDLRSINHFMLEPLVKSIARLCQ